jgi:hypothetical protein
MPACYHKGGVEDLVWYVAYGSNLCRARFGAYLGRGPDPSPPRADRPLTLAHPLWFGGESVVWTGGRAYLDHAEVPGTTTLARAWLVTVEQWLDVHRQEAGPDGDRYPVLLDLGEHEGVPVRTFTGPDRLDLAACTRPAPDYLRRIATGLHESHGLGPDDVARYLLGCPGLAECWTEADLRGALTT